MSVQKSRKVFYGIAIILTLLLLLLLFFFIGKYISKENAPKTPPDWGVIPAEETTYFNEYSIVDVAIERVVSDESFNSLTKEEQVKLVADTLAKLESEEKIIKGSIAYDEAHLAFTFRYTNNAIGGVSLKEFNDETDSVDGA